MKIIYCLLSCLLFISTLILPVNLSIATTTLDIKPSKIVPPKNGKLIGLTSFKSQDISLFEEAIGTRIAIVVDPSLVDGQEEPGDPLYFDVDKAQAYWADGYFIMVGAYEAYPGHKSFTIDKLLRGQYDKQLRKLAAQFRSFGKPMFFSTCREPNNALAEYMGGGFGTRGNKTFEWALDTGKGFAEFKPPSGPDGNPDLYTGLGADDLPDAIERLAAAQRYYYDFFTRREGITFLTFDTMGWFVDTQHPNPYPAGSHARHLLSSCSFDNLLKCLGSYWDWISINWYLAPPESIEESGFSNEEAPLYHAKNLDMFIRKLNRIAPAKPIMITELGFFPPDLLKKITIGIDRIMSYSRIKAIIFWGDSPGENGFDLLIRPRTDEAKMIRGVIESNPKIFPSRPILPKQM